MGIEVNDQIGSYFQTKKGLRQLFNIAVDMLAIIIARAKEDGQVKGVVPHLVEEGLSILQYADDTVIFWTMILTKKRTSNFCYVSLNNYLALK